MGKLHPGDKTTTTIDFMTLRTFSGRFRKTFLAILLILVMFRDMFHNIFLLLLFYVLLTSGYFWHSNIAYTIVDLTKLPSATWWLFGYIAFASKNSARQPTPRLREIYGNPTGKRTLSTLTHCSAGQLGVHDDRDILEGRFSLVFGSPESWLLNSKWRRMLSSPIYQDNLIGITVDEVHVTYKWGEASKGESPFRDSFAKLGELRSIAKEGTPLLALTASADIKSRNRVIRLLHMDNATHIIASPNKKNIRLGLCKVPSDEMNCFDWLVQHVKDKGPTMQPVLIYCQTLKIVGRVFSYLKAELQDFAWVGCDQHRKSDNLLIGMFHSKTLPQHKDRVLASLGGGGGDCRVVVATTALGLGLNFPNVSHVVIYGVPGDLESIIQQVGRAGRNGQQSHGIIYNTGHHFKGGEDLKEMLAASKTTCFRKSLYSHFEAEPSAVEPGHLCCTYCQTVCSCSSGTCAEPTPDYEQIREKAGTQRSRHVTAEDRSLIADLLNGYRASLISPSIRLFTSQEACTGFSQQLVDSVLNHCQYIFDLSYIIANLPVFRLDHAKEILIIISDVFGDVDEDLQSDSGGDFTETDLYYSNYFDNADDDDADVLRSHASSSESEQ